MAEGLPMRLILAVLVVLVSGAILLAVLLALGQNGDIWSSGIFAELGKLMAKISSAKVSVG